MSDKLKVVQPWYADGLRFECTQCGQCCTGAPGYTWVSKEEIATIAEHLGMNVETFSNAYIRRVDTRFSLLEHPKSYDCVFLKDNKCSIYSVRPKQCQTFPWWPNNLNSKESWLEAAKWCEGINPEAPTVPRETIENQLSLQKATNN